MSRIWFVGTTLAALTLSGCSWIPRWSPRLEGQVVDDRSGQPVAGALVVAGYNYIFIGTGFPYGEHWATTDANGRFSIPSHLRGPISIAYWPISKYPYVDVIHPDYGQFFFQYSFDKMNDFPKLEFPGYRKLHLEIEPSDLHRQVIKDPRLYSWMCPSRQKNRTRELCIRACEVAYGSAEVCHEEGLPRD